MLGNKTVESKLIKINFYSTLGCHLCDEAEHLLHLYQTKSHTANYELDINTVDVAKSDELLDLYGLRIPVLKRMDTNNEMGWPFDLPTLVEFLS